MALKHFSLALRIFGISLALVLLWLLLILPWLRDRGQSPHWLLTLLMAGALVGSALWLGTGLYKAAMGPRMIVFRLRYTLEEGALPPGFAQFLENLSQEAGHIIVTFLFHKGHLGLYLEVPAEPGPEGFAPTVRESIRHPDVLGGESQQLAGLLGVRTGLKAYATVTPRRSAAKSGTVAAAPQGAKPLPNLPAPLKQMLEGLQRRLEHTAPPAAEETTAAEEGEPLGSVLLEALLQSGNGELRWHLTKDGQGLVTVAAERPELLRHLAALPATVRRIPRPVWTIPQKLWPPLVRLLEMVRNVYWWCPVYADWGNSLAQQLWLPATGKYPDLDTAKVRFALPADYQQPRPALILGYTTDQARRAAALSFAQGVPSHLLIAGGGAASEPYGLALVEQALRLGFGVLAMGDRFDGLGMLFNSLPPEKREHVTRVFPMAENPPHIGLLNPQAMPQSTYQGALHWLVRFLEAEGISMTANREAVLLCQAVVAASLPDNPDFDLAMLVGLLDQPGTVRELLAGEIPDCPDEVRAFLAANPEWPDWKVKSYAALLGQRLVILRDKVTRPPYLSLAGLLGQGGGLFCSLPLQQGGIVGATSGQLARYIIYSLLHLVTTATLPRPVLLYLGDFPSYLTLALPWQELRSRNCAVVLSSPTLPESALALLPPSLPTGRFASLAMAPAFPDQERLSALLALPPEALDRLRGRNAVLQHLYRGAWIPCTVNVLTACPPEVTEELSMASTPDDLRVAEAASLAVQEEAAVDLPEPAPAEEVPAESAAEEFPAEELAAPSVEEEPLYLDVSWQDEEGPADMELSAALGTASSLPPVRSATPAAGPPPQPTVAPPAPPAAPLPTDPLARARARLRERKQFLQELYAHVAGRVKDVGDIGFPPLPPEE